ncbi:hypothetical protein MSPP1_001860 [Malassezia sp. CBS 17886]|nr:hypothetical protein MSPP1_001860 [Malassezia sp. CBS 17886]
MMNRPMIRGASQAARTARHMPVRSYATDAPAPSALERVQRMATAEPLVYNLRVAGSVAKQVYIAERLAPPTSFGQIASAYRTIIDCVATPSWWTQTMTSGQWRKVAVYGIEAVGIFSIGEMIGKRSIVGYKLKTVGDDKHH